MLEFVFKPWIRAENVKFLMESFINTYERLIVMYIMIYLKRFNEMLQ